MPNHQQKNRILVIEDEPSILKAIAEALRIENFEVFTASDGESGLVQFRTRKPDLVLLDLILPGKNGFEVLQSARQDPECARVPVVILSNLGDEDEIKQGMDLGAVDYLIKADYDLGEIVKIIRRHLHPV